MGGRRRSKTAKESAAHDGKEARFLDFEFHRVLRRSKTPPRQDSVLTTVVRHRAPMSTVWHFHRGIFPHSCRLHRTRNAVARGVSELYSSEAKKS